ncbi:anti-sigma factor domain-containing protein [Promicromonospora sukumoe]|uniref:anti-sigma factor domain-containing protein n=1 Tax=Promicromonospora sukumoe TaxID=88382 RepID=UPI0003A090FF|nr:anti-sigma factor [Promicromonospora sukumoe]
MADQTTATGPGGVPDDVWDLLPGYAMDALDHVERQAVERLLASDADARRALDEYRDVLAAFVVEAEPPAALRSSVLAQVQGTPQVHDRTAGTPVPESAPGGGSPSAGGSTAATSGPASSVAAPGRASGADVVDLDARRRRRRRWGTAVAAVAAVAAIAVPSTIAVQVTAERDRLQEQAQVVSEMLADPDSAVLRASVEGGGEASVLVSGDDMFFHAEGLPELDPDKAYQLWVVEGDGSVSSAGLLALRGDQATALVQGEHGVGMAVSVEPESGSEEPTTAPIVVLGA